MAEIIAKGIWESVALQSFGLVLGRIAGLAIFSVILFMIVDTIIDTVREHFR